jgi:hypothetical protein
MYDAVGGPVDTPKGGIYEVPAEMIKGKNSQPIPNNFNKF